MILELLGLGILGAIGKCAYDEAKQENTQKNSYQQSSKTQTTSSLNSAQLNGEIRQLDVNSHIGSIIDDTGTIYDIIFSQNTFKNFPNNIPKVNDKVTFTKQYVNDRLCASDIKYLKDDDVFIDTRISQQYNNSSNTNHTVKSEPIPYLSQESHESDDNQNQLKLYILNDEQKKFVTNNILLMNGSAPFVSHKNNGRKQIEPSHFMLVEDKGKNEYVVLFLERDYDGMEYHVGLNGIQSFLYRAVSANKAIESMDEDEIVPDKFFHVLPERMYNELKSRVKLYTDTKQTDYSVLSYIKNLSTKELLNTIAYEYEHIRGTLNSAPAMGEYGSIEFAGALLIWKYRKDHLYSDKSQICGSLMINLGDTIGCAYLGMSAGEWSNKMDMVIYTNDVLDYAEWNYIYNYLKENYMIYIHKFEFCRGILSEEERQTIYSSFVKRYNQLDTLSQVFALYQKVGLNLKSDMPFTING